jgi:DNA-binding transcriptional regulator LsrR (DeoR family)
MGPFARIATHQRIIGLDIDRISRLPKKCLAAGDGRDRVAILTRQCFFT